MPIWGHQAAKRTRKEHKVTNILTQQNDPAGVVVEGACGLSSSKQYFSFIKQTWLRELLIHHFLCDFAALCSVLVSTQAEFVFEGSDG